MIDKALALMALIFVGLPIVLMSLAIGWMMEKGSENDEGRSEKGTETDKGSRERDQIV